MSRILFHIHPVKQRTSRAITLALRKRSRITLRHQSTFGINEFSVYIVPENPSQSAPAERQEKKEGA
jgi:hypothetical protein